MKRFVAVIHSAIILGLGVSVLNYVPQDQRESDMYYLGIVVYFFATIWIYLIFYLAVGLPSSWLIDKCRRRYNKRTITIQYFIGAVLYSLVGLFLGTVYYFLMGTKQSYLYDFIEILGFWFVALLLYFQALWALERGFLKNIPKGE